MHDSVTEFTAENREVVLRDAFEAVGLDSTGAELLCPGSNAVYRLTSSPIVVRIARDPAVLAAMERAVGAVRWLATVDFPATRMPAGIAQPLVVRGLVVTFWESAQEHEKYATVGGMAGLLRRFHWLEEPGSLRLPYVAPWPSCRRTWTVRLMSWRRTGPSWRSGRPSLRRSTTG